MVKFRQIWSHCRRATHWKELQQQQQQQDQRMSVITTFT